MTTIAKASSFGQNALPIKLLVGVLTAPAFTCGAVKTPTTGKTKRIGTMLSIPKTQSIASLLNTK